ncbi:MAG: putative pyrophosphatase or phosphodiesterase, AlkP superfamily [Verrucomicrobia bacterium]|nr:putative pyrophosphatase or phosphodiesterase, AlkP superfamily [Verrucomicrobiota bacterium]
MKPVLPLFVFIDACGWEIIRDRPFARALAPLRRPLRSVFGFSSACIPSILSGRWPAEHRNWCYFVYDPKNSPFKVLRPLGWLPRAITSRRIFRRLLSKVLRGPLGFKGYFDLYNLSFRHMPLFDFSEKKSPLQPGGMNRGKNIFDVLVEQGIPYHVSEPARGEEGNLAAMEADIAAEKIDFGFLYWPDLDGLMHRVGNDSPEVPAKLARYEGQMNQLMATARKHYRDVRLYVFSDHGMANCERTLDLRRRLAALPVSMPKDYAVVLDSTMARFWFFNERARAEVTACLAGVPQGRILSDNELTKLGTLFPDRQFGEMIFLVEEGTLVVPSDMGERPLRAMHGYHPDDPHSYAALMTNVGDVPDSVTAIPHVYGLMQKEAMAAHAANGGRGIRAEALSA